MEAFEASSASGDTVSIEEDMKHLGTADTDGNTSNVGDQEGANSIDHVTPESACPNKDIFSLEALEVKNVLSEDNSSTQPTIVGQLLKVDK